MFEPPFVTNTFDAKNGSEVVLVIVMHSFIDGCDALTGHPCWDANAAGMVTTACATLPGVTVMWLQDRHDSANLFAGTEGHGL